MPDDSAVLPRFATSPDGARIAFDAEGAGPAIIPLHGGGQTRRGWREAGYVSAVSPEFTVISMDLRGSGESDKPETARDYAVSRLVEDYPEVEPEDMKCPTLWLVGTLNEPAMAGVEACRDRLTGTRVTLATIEGLNHRRNWSAPTGPCPWPWSSPGHRINEPQPRAILKGVSCGESGERKERSGQARTENIGICDPQPW